MSQVTSHPTSIHQGGPLGGASLWRRWFLECFFFRSVKGEKKRHLNWIYMSQKKKHSFFVAFGALSQGVVCVFFLFVCFWFWDRNRKVGETDISHDILVVPFSFKVLPWLRGNFLHFWQSVFVFLEACRLLNDLTIAPLRIVNIYTYVIDCIKKIIYVHVCTVYIYIYIYTRMRTYIKIYAGMNIHVYICKWIDTVNTTKKTKHILVNMSSTPLNVDAGNPGRGRSAERPGWSWLFFVGLVWFCGQSIHPSMVCWFVGLLVVCGLLVLLR